MRWVKSEITESMRKKNNVIELTNVDGGRPRYISIRAGLDPENQYYVLAAMEYIDERFYQAKHRAIDVLLEYRHESLVLDDFFYKMIEDASLYFCDFYMDKGPDNSVFCAAYYDFQSKHRNPYGALLPAPWVENFKLGLGKIKSLVKENRLDVNNNTLIFEQLSGITEADLEDKDVRSKFFAVEGLRHVINSFDRDRPIQRQAQPYRDTHYRHSEGWMA